jgi:hypothetical protein
MTSSQTFDVRASLQARKIGPTNGMLELSNPDLDGVKLANGMGVEAARDYTGGMRGPDAA